MTAYFPGSVAYDSLQEAFEALLLELNDRGMNTAGVLDSTSVGSSFGGGSRPTRELLAKSFVLTNPAARLVRRPTRAVSVSFAIASFLWFMSGDDLPDMICFYNDRGASFLQDGRFCCAFGSRILRSSVGNQIDLIVQKLKSDPMSRRASIAVFLPKDLSESPKDTPCLFGIQFFIRNQQLLCITTMRSQSAASILPYDIFIITMLQEYIALRLGIKTGAYCHFSHSVHYYLDEEPLVREIIAHSPTLPPPQMPAMPAYFIDELPQLIAAEGTMRNTLLHSPYSTVDNDLFDLGEYSRDLYSCLVGAVRMLTCAPANPSDPPLPGWFMI
jgi:thymidylate synthase